MLRELVLRLTGREAQDVLEYALVFSLVVVVGFVGVVLLGQNITASNAANATNPLDVIMP